MHTDQAFFMRDDTLLGVCHALGEDFGFNPIYLRITLGVLLLWNPTIVLSAYFGAGALVAFSRLIAPNPRRSAKPATAAAHEPEAEQEMALAA